ncbi:hypothetical protein [Actinoplanes regularis]|uniref:Uncharacterized protein n=1 Tax=Actinoplanes regularis TaxID=52697 RepID=A0A238XWJ9_9ACTN|nr:hypothetical protein [Actinoplanes regularis]GIE87736.1 hypothetical protein Are01nite_42160 [Actinoplanes regularis]GLW28129.1 hypothetical protein Areg01_10690 [Actinoplanes regularis]SNR62359.1 hypothetical protein SAMN06264365_10414 [Actinoplanes regularis]
MTDLIGTEGRALWLAALLLVLAAGLAAALIAATRGGLPPRR